MYIRDGPLKKDYPPALWTSADINRPAMQLTGFYNYFDPKRLQIMGRVESPYLDTLSSEERRAAFERFMQYDIAGLVICHSVPAFPECIEMAEKYDRNVFITHEDTSEFQADVITSLRKHLAPRLTTHGVLVEVYGEGLLLIGDSGIGKSETALELIKRGHRLIADDAVEVKRISRDNARTPMQWDDSANAGFTTGTPWIKVNSNYPKVNAKQEVSDPDSVFSYYKKLIRLRHENEIIVYGDYELLAPEDEALFIYTRMLGTQRLMVLCNFTEKEVAIPQEVTEQIPADAKLLIGNYSKQKEEMLQAYEARVYAYHL